MSGVLASRFDIGIEDCANRMAHEFRHILSILAAAIACASTAYCLLATLSALRFRGGANPPGAPLELPPVSILKPLKGADPDMYQALRSHCLQDYPQFEILFGITDPADDAAAAVRKLMAEFPDQKMQIILCDKRLGANGKVSSLAQLAQMANHEFLLVNDSDIRVEPDYLRTVMTELCLPPAGLATCLYRGTPGDTLPSRLEALGISTDFMPGVLTARAIEGGLSFGLGSTLAFRRRELEAIGGFEAIVDYLADDYELGHRIAKQGFEIRLSTAVVETHLPDYDWRGFLAHQLRWARTVRASRPGGYAGLILTFTLPWTLAAVLLSPSEVTAMLLAVALAARFLMAWIAAGLVLQDKKSTRYLWLLPARDLAAVVIWLGGLFGNRIVWRGESFRLDKGKLKPDAATAT